MRVAHGPGDGFRLGAFDPGRFEVAGGAEGVEGAGVHGVSPGGCRGASTGLDERDVNQLWDGAASRIGARRPPAASAVLSRRRGQHLTERLRRAVSSPVDRVMGASRVSSPCALCDAGGRTGDDRAATPRRPGTDRCRSVADRVHPRAALLRSDVLEEGFVLSVLRLHVDEQDPSSLVRYA